MANVKWSNNTAFPVATTAITTGVGLQGGANVKFDLDQSRLTSMWGATAQGAAWVTRQAPNTKAFMATDLDDVGNVTRTYDQASGRMDCYGNSVAGAAFVVAYSAAGANGNNLGHFAYRGKDSAGNYNTFAYALATAADVTAASASSTLALSVMRQVNCTPSGNGQPNWGILIDGKNTQVTMPTGALIQASGNYSTSAATGPTHTFVNSTNSRNLIIGVGDNFSGTVNATGGGSLLLQNSGTTGISISSTVISSLIPLKVSISQRGSKTTNYTIVTTDLGTTFDNNAAAGEVDFTLPTSPTIGSRVRFNVVTAQILKVIAPTSVRINVGSTISATAGNIASSQVGACIDLEYVQNNVWMAQSVTGLLGSAGAGGWTVT